MGNLYYSLAIQQIARGYFTSTSYYYITALKTKTKQNATKAHILLLLLYNVCIYIYTDYITKKYRQHVHITVLNEMPPDSPWRGSAATSPKKGSVQFPRDQGPAEWDALELVECWWPSHLPSGKRLHNYGKSAIHG